MLKESQKKSCLKPTTSHGGSTANMSQNVLWCFCGRPQAHNFPWCWQHHAVWMIYFSRASKYNAVFFNNSCKQHQLITTRANSSKVPSIRSPELQLLDESLLCGFRCFGERMHLKVAAELLPITGRGLP